MPHSDVDFPVDIQGLSFQSAAINEANFLIVLGIAPYYEAWWRRDSLSTQNEATPSVQLEWRWGNSLWHSADSRRSWITVFVDSSPLPAAACPFPLCAPATVRQHVLLAVVERELEGLTLEWSTWHRAGRRRVINELLPSMKRRRHQRPVEEQLGCCNKQLAVASS